MGDRPGCRREPGSLGAVDSGSGTRSTSAALVTANGTYSLRIKNTSSNGADYVTKEGRLEPLPSSW